jgi:hypothetical protein
LQSTLNEVENLGQLLSHIEGFNDAGSSLLKESLQNCQAATFALEALTSRTMLPLSGDSKFRLKHPLKAVLKKKELLWELETNQREDWDTAKQELLELFDSGQALPLDIDPDSETWLEAFLLLCSLRKVLIYEQKILDEPWTHGSWDIQMSLFHMLAQMRTQVSTSE